MFAIELLFRCRTLRISICTQHSYHSRLPAGSNASRRVLNATKLLGVRLDVLCDRAAVSPRATVSIHYWCWFGSREPSVAREVENRSDASIVNE